MDTDATSDRQSDERSAVEDGTPPGGRKTPSGRAAGGEHPYAIGLTVALAACSFASAGGIFVVDGSALPVAGSLLLGVAFLGFVVADRLRDGRVFGSLAESWDEHGPYAGGAAGLFGLCILFGALLYVLGVDLASIFYELIIEELGEGVGDDPEAFEEGLTASFFIVQNTPPFLASILGAITLGLLTFVIMALNGVLVGNVVMLAGAEGGFLTTVLLLVPHGVFELTALFVAAGIGFRLVVRFVERVGGRREAFLNREYVLRTLLLVLFAWLVLVLAAFVEAYLTIEIADAVVGTVETGVDGGV